MSTPARSRTDSGTYSLHVPGAWAAQLSPHLDERGSFVEWLREGDLRERGLALTVAQANCSTSQRGVIRGIHYTDVPPGQEKYVMCVAGEVLDVLVDIRVGSPAFGEWDAIELGGENWTALYIPRGVGHAFMALSEQATVIYLCSIAYQAGRERAVDPLDRELGLPWPADLSPILSARDRAAPSLGVALEQGLLPRFEDCGPGTGAWAAGRPADPALEPSPSVSLPLAAKLGVVNAGGEGPWHAPG
jgi:dTDP-4-dehydrorhamnose 3,5-epimerase